MLLRACQCDPMPVRTWRGNDPVATGNTQTRSLPLPVLTEPLFSRPKPLSVLDGDDEGLDHFGLDKVSVELVELVKPEVIPGEVGVWPGIDVAPQVTVVLHQHERLVFLAASELRVLRLTWRTAAARPCVVLFAASWSINDCVSDGVSELPVLALSVFTKSAALIPDWEAREEFGALHPAREKRHLVSFERPLPVADQVR